MRKELVSVLLPVYNGMPYVKQAIESILAQTYQNFELIVIDDGSSDESASVIREIEDNRVFFYQQTNMGLAATLNRAIGLSKGPYLARQDQDDYSQPQRFEKQVEFLEKHPDYGVVGTWAENIETHAQRRFLHARPHHKQPPAESFALKYTLLFDSPFVHSSVMIRKSALDKVGLYSTDASRQPPEDYELWSRIGRECEIANISDFLQIYRRGPQSMTRLADNAYIDCAMRISIENICHTLGEVADEQAVCDLAALTNGGFHRVLSRPSFRCIAGILNGLTEKLSGGIQSRHKVLNEMADHTMECVRQNYLSFRYGKVLGLIIFHVSRRGFIRWPR